MISQPCVYVVDDDEAAASSLEALILSIGLRARKYLSSVDFMADYHDGMRGCLILDLKMPELSGPELQERLLRRNCRMPMIFVSGHVDEAVRGRVLRNGAVACFDKPFPAAELCHVIRQAMTPPGTEPS